MTPDATQAKEKAKLFMAQYKNKLVNNRFSGIGVGMGDNGKPCIAVYLENNNGKDDLPSVFEGFEVKISVIGTIVAYED